MGGAVSNACNKISGNIWELYREKRLWISAEHIPGSKNITADFISRTFNGKIEWQLSPKIFKNFGPQDTRIYKQ